MDYMRLDLGELIRLIDTVIEIREEDKSANNPAPSNSLYPDWMF